MYLSMLILLSEGKFAAWYSAIIILAEEKTNKMDSLFFRFVVIRQKKL